MVKTVHKMAPTQGTQRIESEVPPWTVSHIKYYWGAKTRETDAIEYLALSG